MADDNVRFSFRITDELMVEAAAQVYATVDDGTTLGELVTEWGDLATAIEGVTSGSCTRGQVAVMASRAAAGGRPAAGSRVEQTGVANYIVTASGKHYGIAIPCLANSQIVAGKWVIGSGTGATLVAALTGALAAGTGTMASAGFQALGALADAFVSFRKRRKQLFRESVEV